MKIFYHCKEKGIKSPFDSYIKWRVSKGDTIVCVMTHRAVKNQRS